MILEIMLIIVAGAFGGIIYCCRNSHKYYINTYPTRNTYPARNITTNEPIYIIPHYPFIDDIPPPPYSEKED